MEILLYIVLGFAVAASGSISPSFLNLTVVKFSLKSGIKAAIFLILGFATILFFQANIGAYLASILMKNSEYISTIQKIGTVILFLLSAYFLRLHFLRSKKPKKVEIRKSKAYLQGLIMATLNTFAIPFYFTSISFLIGLDYFEYSLENAFYFSIGSTLGSFTIYSIYATIAKKIENKLTSIASKMDLILSILTGSVAILNVFLLLNK